MRRGNGSRILHWFLGGVILVVGSTMASGADQPAKKKPVPAAKNNKAVAPSAPPEAWLKSEAWKGVATTPLQPGEIDQLLEKEFPAAKVQPSPRTTDEQFLRRIRLDLTGQLPTVAEIEQFLANPDPQKRARWIDRLLDSDAYAHHWARYWRDTVTAVEAPFGKVHVPAFEGWLYEQIKQNRNWGEVVRALLTATGSLKKDDTGKNGAIFFLGRHVGPDGSILMTAETARLFLGIQIQCAQCHNDRRTKLWKQVQFHEMAGFFARMTVGGSSGSLIKVGEKKFGEHKMPGRTDPKQGLITYPRFLDGKAPATNGGDQERRKALAEFLTARDNYWFAAAYTNRVWNELLGQGFYERADDLSPKSPLLFPTAAHRLAAAFAGSNYDTKCLIRAIANSAAYQRQVRVGEAVDQHLRFAAVYPARLRCDVLWEALSNVLVRMPTSPFQIAPFAAEFEFDPSLKADEVTGSIPQALWLLNSQLVNDRVKVGDVPRPPVGKKGGGKGGNKKDLVPSLLKQLLSKHGDNDLAVLRALYLQTLARRPTDREVQTCLAYVQENRQGAGTRNEAFEDVLKALINTAEFQRRR